MARAKVQSRKSNGHKFDARIVELQEDFESLQNAFGSLLDHMAQNTSEGLSGAAQSAGETISDAATQMETWSEAGTETVRGAIRTQPLAAIALSMGAGALLGAYMRR